VPPHHRRGLLHSENLLDRDFFAGSDPRSLSRLRPDHNIYCAILAGTSSFPSNPEKAGMNQATVDGMIEAHPADPELSELLQSEMPHRANSANDLSVRHHWLLTRGELGGSSSLARAFSWETWWVLSASPSYFRRPCRMALSRGRAETIRAIEIVYSRYLI
jgi:hypothetical protein